MKSACFARREFFKQAAAAVAAPYVITSTALGAGQKAPASDRVGLAHFGIGERGRRQSDGRGPRHRDVARG